MLQFMSLLRNLRHWTNPPKSTVIDGYPGPARAGEQLEAPRADTELHDPIEVTDEVEGVVLIFADDDALAEWESSGEATWAETRPIGATDRGPLEQLDGDVR